MIRFQGNNKLKCRISVFSLNFYKDICWVCKTRFYFVNSVGGGNWYFHFKLQLYFSYCGWRNLSGTISSTCTYFIHLEISTCRIFNTCFRAFFFFKSGGFQQRNKLFVISWWRMRIFYIICNWYEKSARNKWQKKSVVR